MNSLLLMTISLVGISTTLFILVGIQLFREGWESYEDKYLEQAERNIESMFLTIPPQQLYYLSFLAFFFLGGGMLLVTEKPFPSFVIGTSAFLGPPFILRFLKKRREKRFREQLVPALQCLAGALKSGFSLEKSFEQLEKEASNPLKQETRILLQELRLGTTIENAIEHMHDRMPGEDLDLIVNAIGIAGRVGGNLPLIFNQLEKVIRERVRIEGKLSAMTSQGKLQGLVIAALPLVVLVAMNAIYPEMTTRLFTTLTGWIILITVAILDALGYLVIRKIVSIEI